MGLDTRGRIHKVEETKQVTERFRKREFVVELSDNPRYPQFVMFQLTGDRCESLEGFQSGDEVQLDFSLHRIPIRLYLPADIVGPVIRNCQLDITHLSDQPCKRFSHAATCWLTGSLPPEP